MATITSAPTNADGVLFGRVQWSSSPVTFHRNTGKNVELTENNRVATRVRNRDYALVFTNEPMVVGQMLKVTMTQRGEDRYGGMVRAHLVCVDLLPSCHIIIVDHALFLCFYQLHVDSSI